MRLLVKSALLAAAVVLVAAPALAAGPISFGAQVSYADDADLGLGVRAMMDTDEIVENSRVAASFDWFFPDDEGSQIDLTYWELNVNGHYGLPLEFEAPIELYVGGGINFAHISFDIPEEFQGFGIDGADDSDVGLNILGGIDFPLGTLGGYGELRLELGGGEEFVITGGVRF